MNFLARWLSESLGLALALAFAVAAMQAPSLTHDYAAALLQVAREAGHDIDLRIAAARERYAITAEDDAQFVAALRAFEPSNAETLAAAMDRTRRLRAAYDRIAGAPPLLQPLVAVWDAIADAPGDRAMIRRTLLETYTPQLSFSTGAVLYGLAGLLLGTLTARLLLSAGRGAASLVAGRLGTRRYAR